MVNHTTNNNNNNINIKQQQQEQEDPQDSFIDSLLNFDNWVEDSNKQLTLIMDSKQETNEENVSGSEKLLLGDLIQQGLDKVSITSPSANDVVKQENEVKQENGVMEVKNEVDDGVKEENKVMEVKTEVKNEDESESSDDDDESGSSSSVSLSSGDSSSEEEEQEEEEEEEEEGEVGVEEGEMSEKMVSWSDEDEDEDVVKGPVRSKNEVQDLPPVPPVTVTIQPHHQTLPVGVVLSIMGAQVIVEGVDNHKPLSEGSILWITECRSPLGVVDEIFGPVKNPYYIVRFNSESEVPAGIEQGSLISFVPEFADYVLNNNNLYQKGYDASGANDEELSEELEFSDDEKEAEYKKMIKMSKRGLSEQKNGNMKKDKKSRNRGGNSKMNPQPSPNTQVSGSSSGPTSGPQAFLPGPQAPNFNGPQPLGVWQNGFPAIQPQNMGFPPNIFPSNAPFMQPNMMQQPFQNIGLPNFTPFNPQFNNSGQMFPSNFVQGVSPNFGVNPAFASWLAAMPQNNFNQSQLLNQSQVGPAGMPQNNFNQSQVRPSGMPQNNFNQSQVGPAMVFQSLPQGAVIPNGFQMENNGAVRPSVVSGNNEASQNTNRGNGFSNRGGRKPFQRGGGRFRGGRSGPQSR